MILLDNHVSPAISRALRSLGENVDHVQKVPALGGKADDVDILKYLAKTKGVLITLNRRMLEVPHEHEAMLQNHAGIFLLRKTHGTEGNLTLCEQVQWIIRAWPEIKRLKVAGQRPFLGVVRGQGKIRMTTLGDPYP